MEYVKQHKICLLDAHEIECARYQSEYEKIKVALRARTLPARGQFGSFVPYQQWVRLDALNTTDWPNGIAENSIYISFKIDMKEHKFEVSDCGHIYLSEADQEASYLCMCSMRKAVEAMGGKWMRKSAYKDAEDLAKKVRDFWTQAIECVKQATGGYPYKQMRINIYAK